MKPNLLLGFMFAPLYAHAGQAIVPLDMELGYWEITSEMGKNDIIDQMLASLPESQRAQMRAMMEGNMKPPVVKQCITEASLKDMDKQLQEALGAQQHCQFEVTKSTNKEFMGELNCSGNMTTVHTKVISSKRQESNVITNMADMGSANIRTIAVWKSNICPSGL